MAQIERAGRVLVVERALAHLRRVARRRRHQDHVDGELGAVVERAHRVDDEVDGGGGGRQAQVRQVGVALVLAQIAHLELECAVGNAICRLADEHKRRRRVVVGAECPVERGGRDRRDVRRLVELSRARLIVELVDVGERVAGLLEHLAAVDGDRVAGQLGREQLRPVEAERRGRLRAHDEDGKGADGAVHYVHGVVCARRLDVENARVVHIAALGRRRTVRIECVRDVAVVSSRYNAGESEHKAGDGHPCCETRHYDSAAI